MKAITDFFDFFKRLQTGTAQRVLFVAIVLLMFAALGAMIVEREQILASPTQVLLECEPVDPRSILSGDYVILRYRISRFDGEEVGQLNVFNEAIRPGSFVYLALRETTRTADGKRAVPIESAPRLHTAVAFSQNADLLRTDPRFADTILLRGKLVDASGLQQSLGDDYRYAEFEFGLEDYFVPQNEGRWIERELAGATVSVAIAENGQSAVRDLFLDGEKVRFH